MAGVVRALLVVSSLVSAVVLPVAPAQASEVSAESVVEAAYEGLLGRAPDASGLAHWVGQIDSGLSAGVVVGQIGDSLEQRRHVVAGAYRDILGRSPDTAGLDYWADLLVDKETAGDLHALFFSSPEYLARSGGDNQGFVTGLYRDVLNRAPEGAGLAYWIDQIAGGTSREQVAAEFLRSPEGVLQPELSVVRAEPNMLATATRLNTIEVTLDRNVNASASAMLVSANGQRLAGTVVAGATPADLVFEPERPPTGLTAGQVVPVIVTVFAFDGMTVERVDYRFSYQAGFEGGSLDYMLVAFYGHPTTGVLGVAGEGTPEQILPRLLAQAEPYRIQGRPVVPAFELIATLVTASPGPDNHYRSRVDHAAVRPYIDAIRAVGGQVILDIQPGRADFLDEARSYEDLLLEPEVGLAMDPEWVVGPNQTPAGRVGTVDGSVINEVSAYLSNLVVANDLPDKILIVHRFRPDMVTNTDIIVSRPGVVILFQADGEGGPGAKIADYNTLLPNRFARGFKVFYDEDSPPMSPAAVLALNPDPDYVSYQ